MSNVINFLERIGQDARLRDTSDSELELALLGEQVNSELREAIFSEDQSQLQVLLGQASFCCAMFPVKEGEEESEESPAQGDEEISMHDASLAIARAGY
ncbi:hypothetical protein [Rhodanobacter sp. T12-5]|uniref:hypothetical protein n=1 Tax=Rhodanobacter sp. T12-5 TaxID=2024611 RepID=UPI0011ED562D|nr:hypothetical protein [Rhodanobacter sp. T12-5]KAA0070650.1 hypothetical protein CIW53_04610 [Rhodanobacter sp. T12-5]